MNGEELLKIIRRAEKQEAAQLDLSEYKITQLPPEIGRLTSLQVLILRGLGELPPEIGRLRNLTRLYLSSNELDTLPPAIFDLRNLDRLHLSSNHLTELPPEIARLKNLSILDLNSNELTELPREISELKNLSVLYLSSNQLNELPREISKLKNLTILDVSSNQLRELPREISKLRNLTRLYLNSNQLSTLPKEIVHLKNLSILDLNSNHLSALSDEIVHLKDLSILDLNSNHLHTLPREIAQLRNLTELNLSSNQLSVLPPEIAQLRNLTRLYLSFNHLSELPGEISRLRNLTRLDLTSNQLEELPPKIGELRNLTVLYLDSNELTKLPKEITHLKNLIHLDLSRNPLIFPPVEIASQGLSAITDYLKNSDKGGQTLYEGKLLVVGQGGVGKTCLINRLTEDEYSEREATTEGIDIRSWKVNAPTGTKTEMTLNVWDFGGQEIYHATHQFFLTQRSLYIIVWDARQEEEYARIDYWLNTIETFAEDSPVLIVMNKADERNKDLNIKDMKQRCPQIITSRKVSAKEGTGIEALRKFIGKYAWKLPLMGTFWPSSWLAVRKALKATPRYHVPHKNYLQVCKKVDIEEKEAGTLSRYLHDLGIILHFQDDALLKDTIILKPEWGTDAVYKILDAKIVQERNGILYNKDLPKIWTNRTLYPRDRYATILRLMTNFELAFPFGKGDRHIVAEFLSLKESEFDWNPTDYLQFEYHYDFLPAGVITRLIVRMHEFLVDRDGEKLCWREGAYFENDEALAVVRINPYSKTVKIKIDGDKNREFLEVIRSHFNAIHKSIKKIRFKEKAPCFCTPDCDHRFDYKFLLKCEEKGIKKVLCEKSADYINVKKLLDCIEKPEVRWEMKKEKTDDRYNIPYIDPNLFNSPNQRSRTGVRIFTFTLAALAIIFGAFFIWTDTWDIGKFLKDLFSKVSGFRF